MTDNTKPLVHLLCPNCDKPMVEAYKPFCSKRCADVDLGQWFNGSYSIPAVEPPDDWSEHALLGQEEEQWKH